MKKIAAPVLVLILGAAGASVQETPRHQIRGLPGRDLAVPSVRKVTLDAIPAATKADVEKWNNVVRTFGGIAGNDFFGVQPIGLAPAKSKCALQWFPEWFPIEDPPGSGYGAKKSVCGTLVDYHQTGGPYGYDDRVGYLDEIIDDFRNPSNFFHDQWLCDHDYDIDISPAPLFMELLSRATNLSEGWRDKIHAEIDLPFDVNPRVFDLNVGPSFLKNLHLAAGTVCVYGPWVIDDNRPLQSGPPGEVLARKVEIHPAEQIWFGNRKGASLISTADYSQRYDGRADYDTADFLLPNSGPRTYTRPWAETPLQSRFAVAFEIKPGAPELWYRLNSQADHHMTAVSPGFAEHALVLKEPGGERLLIRVSSELATIGFEQVKRRSDGTIQGYLTISSTVGRAGVNGGHVMYWLLEGQTPAEYTVEILTIKRLAKNSYEFGPGSRRIVVPVNPLPAGYDETFARFTLETSTQTRQFDIPLGVGEIRTRPGTRLNGLEGPFDFGADILLKAQDSLGKNMGIAHASVSNQWYGQTRTIQVKMLYPNPRTVYGSEGPGSDPSGRTPPAPAPGGVMLKPGPGATSPDQLVRTVERFEITYRVTRAVDLGNLTGVGEGRRRIPTVQAPPGAPGRGRIPPGTGRPMTGAMRPDVSVSASEISYGPTPVRAGSTLSFIIGVRLAGGVDPRSVVLSCRLSGSGETQKGEVPVSTFRNQRGAHEANCKVPVPPGPPWRFEVTASAPGDSNPNNNTVTIAISGAQDFR